MDGEKLQFSMKKANNVSAMKSVHCLFQLAHAEGASTKTSLDSLGAAPSELRPVFSYKFLISAMSNKPTGLYSSVFVGS